MSTLGKTAIGLVGLGVIGAIIAANLTLKGDGGAEVTREKIERRDIESFVNTSGKTRAKLDVNISANTTGPIKRIPVRAGQAVAKGDPLCQIDPKEIQTAIAKAGVAVEEARTRLTISEKHRDRAKADLDRLMEAATASKKELDTARSDFEVKMDEVHAASLALQTAQTELERAEHELTKVELVSPIDGIVTKVHLKEGEMVYGGQMAGGAGTVIMVVSDVSEMQVELQVDETEIIRVKPGQEARVQIDAYPDTEFKGVVTEVAESPRAGDNQAVTFDVVVTLTERGNPAIKSLPLMTIVNPSSIGTAEPIFILMSSAVLSPMARLKVFLM